MGYFKHKANEIEKQISSIKADFKQDNVQSKRIADFIKYLADQI